MLPRVLETEVMDTAEEASEYNAMDHSEVNRVFVQDWIRAWTAFFMPTGLTQVLDVGTGTALIPIEFCRHTDLVHIAAVDLADEMLLLAKRNVEAAGLEAAQALARFAVLSGTPYRRVLDAVLTDAGYLPEPAVTVESIQLRRTPAGSRSRGRQRTGGAGPEETGAGSDS